jgi:hypothetical protein
MLTCRQTNNYGVKQFEHVILCNLMPETPEEAYAVLPSLKVWRKQELQWS